MALWPTYVFKRTIDIRLLVGISAFLDPYLLLGVFSPALFVVPFFVAHQRAFKP